MPVEKDFPSDGTFRVALRDYFADSALHSLIVGGFSNLEKSWADCAAEAYKIADAMLVQREKR
jgi:hypothetical protein